MKSSDTQQAVIGELAQLCDYALADKRRIANSMFFTSGEADRLLTACVEKDIEKIVSQLHGYHGEPSPREYLSRLEALRRAVNITPHVVVTEPVAPEFQAPLLGF